MRLFPRFMLSALAPEQFPQSEVPEFAFLGRSNVGKSSLINALVGSKEAKVSSTPGRTRAINFFALYDAPQKRSPRFLFADLPGYGYAKISKSISSEWPKFVEPYLANRTPLAMCVCLVDSRIPAQPGDAQLIRYLAETGRKYLVVATKADKLSGNSRLKAQSTLKAELEIDKILMISAKTGAGMKELWAAIATAADEASAQ